MGEILTTAHDMAKDLHAVGALDAAAMRMMDELLEAEPGTALAAPEETNGDLTADELIARDGALRST